MENTTTQIALMDENQIKDFRLKLQNFMSLLNRQPDKKHIKEKDKAKYVPIGIIENGLDELFFGLWETENFKYQLIGNEIVGDLELVIVHPRLGIKMRRVGAGAVQIRQLKDAMIDTISKTKIKTALQMDFPHLKAECLKNAAKSFGKYFGRDLNRDYWDEYAPLVKDNSAKSKEVVDGVRDAMGIKPKEDTTDKDLFDEQN